MKYVITESQSKSFQKMIQGLINLTLDTLKEESEDWGMGEMDEIDEVQSVDKIVVNRVVKIIKIKVYVNIHKNSNRHDFDNLRAEIQYRLERWFPNIELYIEDIIDDRKFGPGIDW
jgi:hypothetical protein